MAFGLGLSSLGRHLCPLKTSPIGQPAFVTGLGFLFISFLNPQSQSYSLSEGSQQLPKGDTLPSAGVQPLSHPSGSGEPEPQQSVSTLFSL